MKNIIFAVVLLRAANLYGQTNADDGKTIFNAKCASCHNVKVQVVGPALMDVTKRHTEAWIIKFVHSSQSMVKSGDTQATRLFKQYNQIVMPDHADLTETDIKNIMAYIDLESVNIAKTVSLHPRPYERKGPERPILLNDYYTLSAFGFFIFLLLLGFGVLINALDSKKKFYDKKNTL